MSLRHMYLSTALEKKTREYREDRCRTAEGEQGPNDPAAGSGIVTRKSSGKTRPIHDYRHLNERTRVSNKISMAKDVRSNAEGAQGLHDPAAGSAKSLSRGRSADPSAEGAQGSHDPAAGSRRSVGQRWQPIIANSYTRRGGSPGRMNVTGVVQRRDSRKSPS